MYDREYTQLITFGFERWTCSVNQVKVKLSILFNYEEIKREDELNAQIKKRPLTI